MLHCIAEPPFVRYLTSVPAHTEVRIHQLCTEALAAKTQADVDRIVPELRSALEEHIRLAKDSLAIQASTLALLNGRLPLTFEKKPHSEE